MVPGALDVSQFIGLPLWLMASGFSHVSQIHLSPRFPALRNSFVSQSGWGCPALRSLNSLSEWCCPALWMSFLCFHLSLIRCLSQCAHVLPINLSPIIVLPLWCPALSPVCFCVSSIICVFVSVLYFTPFVSSYCLKIKSCSIVPPCFFGVLPCSTTCRLPCIPFIVSDTNGVAKNRNPVASENVACGSCTQTLRWIGNSME